jgi:hypothetical protein
MTIAKESKELKEVFALAASKDPDTMYYHKAMREPDREEFKGAMKKEVEAHTKNEVWELIKKSAVPKGHKIMPSKNQKSILRCCRNAHDKKHSTRTVWHYHQSSSAKHFGTHGAQ